MGACRCRELYTMKISDIRDLSSSFLVTIPTRKIKLQREFTIAGNFYDIVKKYVNLRPSQTNLDSFFLNYLKGKCIQQNIGIHNFSRMGKQIASFLKKPNPEQYSGLAFCKSSPAVQTMTSHEDHSVEIDEASTSTTFSSQNFQIKSEDEDVETNPNSLPKKSAKKYEDVYNTFVEWQQKKGHTLFTEEVVMEYFDERSKKYSSSSLWTHYSMLRSTLDLHHNVKINEYSKLKEFLKGKSVRYEAKQVNTLSTDDINTFLSSAPDYDYLSTKVNFCGLMSS